MNTIKSAGVILIVLLVFFFISHRAGADVAPGDTIDPSNWEQAEGLLPQPVLDWVKKGDYALHIASLNHEPAEHLPAWLKESLKGNQGRYDLDEKSFVIDAETRERVWEFTGFPFPVIDATDPKAGVKVMLNKYYHLFAIGNVVYPFNSHWVGRSTGHERQIGAVWISAPLAGYPGASELKNREGIERYCLVSVRAPFDIRGTTVLLWRYPNERQDSNYSYVPAIRRVRRMSPANRSDSFVGTDYCVDDAWGYDGKIQDFTWTYVRSQTALVPYLTTDVEKAENGEDAGTLITTTGMKLARYNYESKGTQGAPWAAVNWVWVKRPVHVLKGQSRDPYYNYGETEFWIDSETFLHKYSLIHDRSGAYWKTFISNHTVCEGPEQKVRFHTLNAQQMVDDRTDHSTVSECYSKKNIWEHWVVLDLNDFSLAGFQKYCK